MKPKFRDFNEIKDCWQDEEGVEIEKNNEIVLLQNAINIVGVKANYRETEIIFAVFKAFQINYDHLTLGQLSQIVSKVDNQ